LGLDCWNKDRPLTCSGDRTARVWKIAEDSHLVFRGHKSSVDTVQILTADSFVSGGADGSLCLWKESQKKPVAQVRSAHGIDGDDGLQNPRWISSLGSLKMSDLVASGSNSGYIKLWSVNPDDREFSECCQISCPGFVNGLAMSTKLLVAGTGSEHRLGRWWRMKGSLNKVVIVRLPELESAEGGRRTEENELDDDSSNSGDSVSDDSASI
jgi:ribosomal RNA-processing protein 9